MSLANLFDKTLNLMRVTRTSDGMGGWTENWESQGTFKGRISPLGSSERMIGDKIYASATHKVYCEAMDIREDDRLVWGSWTFQILGIVNPSEGAHFLQILVQEIE